MRALAINRSVQAGAVAVEFALTMMIFIALVIAVMEFARLAYIYSTAVEATRLGARIAAVCDDTDAQQLKVKAKMKAMLNLLEAGNISITYPGSAGCTLTDCTPVTVSTQNVAVPLSIPFIPLSFSLPAFTTSIPNESLDSTDNPVCD